MAKKKPHTDDLLDSLSVDQLVDVQRWVLIKQHRASGTAKFIRSSSQEEASEWVETTSRYWDNVSSGYKELIDRIERVIDKREGRGGHGRRADTGSH